ncbi:hypothetical protein SAMN04488135_10568 [Pollutimonas bauzanensis]|uniref:Uncharacterized protein n=1 Tax=Pollutimonas bauzanensis TaxID=658167 RepID=A0A1M5W3Z7_9BURK|nr:hypothetical protein SAMN04488135_10568 [Pollutimonas bauzanensis]
MICYNIPNNQECNALEVNARPNPPPLDPDMMQYNIRTIRGADPASAPRQRCFLEQIKFLT